MPRGRCHFALLLRLQDALEQKLPQVSGITRDLMPDFLGGSLAPDAMRLLGKMGKYNSHFYDEGRRETWGKSVSGMFAAHPDLADYDKLAESDRVLLMGYIAHLTTDEAFRDEVTIHVHGIKDWRPIIHGLWSFVDELAIERNDLAENLDRFSGHGQVGFIDRGVSLAFLDKARGWATSEDPVAHEQVFLKMVGRNLEGAEVVARLEENRGLAQEFFDASTQEKFVDEAVARGVDEIEKFATGVYAESSRR